MSAPSAGAPFDDAVAPRPAAHPAAALANLAFGSLSHAASTAHASGVNVGRHLAFLPADALELDLDDPAQRHFGDYELLELIGEGGMGVVYRAHQSSLDRQVAVKLLAAGPWASRQFVERFLHEAQNAARMQHPNIVTIHEVGTAEELHFFSMQLVVGANLAQKLHRDGPFEPRRAAALMRVVAEAVAYAHSLGVLHLDLKPANVLLDENDMPHVADFGLARRLDHTFAVIRDEVSGTPSYMAPEQAGLGVQPLTRATDIWGLGAILYEMVSGQPPFRAENAQATLKLVRDEAMPSPRNLRPNLPLDFEAIVLKCMTREADARYGSARELADDLARFVEGRAVRARPLNRAQRIWRWARREPKLAAATLLAVAALLVGIAATTQQWRRASLNAARADANAGTARERLWQTRDEAALRFAETGDGWNAAAQELANLREQTAQENVPEVDVTRKRLGIVENANPRLIDAVPEPQATVLAFSADASYLAIGTDQRELRLLDTQSGAELWRVAIPQHIVKYDYGAVWRLTFSNDGRRLIATSASPSHGIPHPAQFQMLLFDTEHGERLVPPPAFGTLADASYSDDGHYAVLTDTTLQSQLWQTDPWRPVGVKRRIDREEQQGPIWIARNGEFLATIDTRQTLTLVDAHTLRARATPALTAVGHPTAWAMSVDSRWLALGDDDGRVVLVDCRSAAIHVLNSHPLLGVRWLTFSEDGSWLAAAAGKAGVFVWDLADDRLIAPPFGNDPPADQVQIDREHARALVSTFSGEAIGAASLWQIAPTRFNMDRTDAVLLGDRFSAVGSGGSSAVAWHPQTGLVASVRLNDARQRVAQDTLLRLERLPTVALKNAHAAPIKPSVLNFDGRHLVGVDGHDVRLLDARDEHPLAAPITLPQPPGFAELSVDGALLIVSSGREVRVYNVATGALRFAPILLDNSPQRIEIAPNGSYLATTWLDHDAGGVVEVAETWSLVDGRRSGGPLRLPGPLEGIAFDAEAKRVLFWQVCELALRDVATLAPITAPATQAADMRAPDCDASTAPDRYFATATLDAAGTVLAVAVDDRATDALVELRRFAATSMRRQPLWDTVSDLLPMQGSSSVLVTPSTGPVELLGEDGRRALFEDNPARAPGRAIAVSADGRWIARALRDGAEIFDADQHRIALLRTPLPLPDRVWQLAFSPDGASLLGRSVRNRYMVWNLAPDTRAGESIQREFTLRGVADQRAPAGLVATTAERAALRGGDPGAPPAAVRSSEFGMRQVAGGAIPQRDPAAPATTIDLTSYYNFALGGVHRASMHAAADFAWVPSGVQRWLGVDYDIRGGIQLVDPVGFDDRNLPGPAAVDIPLGKRTIAAIDTLMFLQYTVARDDPIADIDLVYVDGTRASLPILFGRDAWNYWRLALGLDARVASVGLDARGLDNVDGRPAHIYAVHRENPHPERVVASVRLRADPGAGATSVVLALTLQP